MVFGDLEEGEYVIKETEAIRVRTEDYSALLTNKRVILRPGKDSEEKRPISISLGSIRDISENFSAGGDPRLTLKVGLSNGGTSTLLLLFRQYGSTTRTAERNEWAAAIASSSDLSPAALISELSESRTNIAEETEILPDSGDDERVCMFCGKPVYQNSVYCHNCGKNVAFLESPIYGKIQGPGELKEEEEQINDPTKAAFWKEVKQNVTPHPPPETEREPRTTETPIYMLTLRKRFSGLLRSPSEMFGVCCRDKATTSLLFLILTAATASAVNAIAVIYGLPRAFPAYAQEIYALGPSGKVAATLFAILLLALFILVIAEMILIHMGVLIARGKGGIGMTFRTCCYASAPFAAIGLIPLAGILLAPIWTFILQIKGIKKMHGLSTARAAFSAFWPFIFLILLGAVAAALLSHYGMSPADAAGIIRARIG